MPITNIQMFDNVYNLAKNATSLEDLKQKLAKEPPETYIDIISPNFPYFTAAGLLASEGQGDKVEWLRQLDASVDQIARGYAYSGDHSKTRSYINDYNADVIEILHGYIESKQWEVVDLFLQLAKINPIIAAEICSTHDYKDRIDYYEKQYIEDEEVQEWEFITFEITSSFLERFERLNSQRKNKVIPEVVPNLIAKHYAFLGNDQKVEEYLEREADPAEVIYGYALAGNDKKVRECLKRFKNNERFSIFLQAAINGYVLNKYHDLVETLRIEFKATPEMIAYQYTGDNQHDKAAYYISAHNADFVLILRFLIQTKHWQLVDAHLKTYNISSLIAAEFCGTLGDKEYELYYEQQFINEESGIWNYLDYGVNNSVLARLERLTPQRDDEFVVVETLNKKVECYALLGNHDMVEVCFQEGADIELILDGYDNIVDGHSIPPFYNALLKLRCITQTDKNLYNCIKDSMLRLQEGKDSSSWYWMNSGAKLEAIINAINNLPEDASITTLMEDKESKLYQALNMQRISPFTFFGGFAANESQTLRVVRGAMNDMATVTPALVPDQS